MSDHTSDLICSNSAGRLAVGRGLSNDLENEVRKLLTQLVNAEPGGFIIPRLRGNPLELEAMRYLEDIGAFEKVGSGSYRVTAHGREHWERLNAPRWFWFRQNWFPASVAGATIVAASVSAAANIANLVL